MNVQCSGGSRSFAKEMRALKMSSKVAVGNWQRPIERIIEADHHITTWEVAKVFNIDHSVVIQHLKKTGKVKKLDKWVPHELTKNLKKIVVLKCCLLLFYTTTTNHFLIRLWCAMKSGFYTITGDNQLSGWTEKKLQSTSQSQTCTKKSHGHCLAVCCQTDPL